jgi:hypothetical protein
MTPGEMIYLIGVVCAFGAFTVVLSTIEYTERRKRRAPPAPQRMPNLDKALPA